jgi:hypothetical protein
MLPRELLDQLDRRHCQQSSFNYRPRDEASKAPRYDSMTLETEGKQTPIRLGKGRGKQTPTWGKPDPRQGKGKQTPTWGKADPRQGKADTHPSAGDGGLSPNQLARLASRALAYLRAAAESTCGSRSDADEVEWFLSRLPASACTSWSSDIMRDLGGRGPSHELPAQQSANRDDQSAGRAARQLSAEPVAHKNNDPQQI